MKKICSLLFGLFLLVGMAGMANAISFTNNIDWAPNITIADNFQYTHTLNLDPPGVSLNSATLELRHQGNSNYQFLWWGELWFAQSGNNVQIGRLSSSAGSWATDTFPLGGNILNEMTGTTPWSLQVKLYESTLGSDYLTLDYSRLYGDYTAYTAPPAPLQDPPPSDPVATPEPATLILFGSGLVGLVKFRKKMRRS